MSIYQKLTPHVDLSCLKEALDRLQIPFAEAQGRSTIDYYTWRNYSVKGQANLVIRQQHMGSSSVGDCGFIVGEDGKVTVDADLAHGMAREVFNTIMQTHSRVLVERAARVAGFRLVEQPGSGRVIRLQAHPTAAASRLQPTRRGLQR